MADKSKTQRLKGSRCPACLKIGKPVEGTFAEEFRCMSDTCRVITFKAVL